MKYDRVNQIIKMKPDKAGTYELKFRLDDEDGGFITERIEFHF
jgi:hypothetical protein